MWKLLKIFGLLCAGFSMGIIYSAIELILHNEIQHAYFEEVLAEGFVHRSLDHLFRMDNVFNLLFLHPMACCGEGMGLVNLLPVYSRDAIVDEH